MQSHRQALFSCSGALFNSQRDGTERTVQMGLATAPPSNPALDAAINQSAFMKMKCADSTHLHASRKECCSVSVCQWQEGQGRWPSQEHSASLGLLAYRGRCHHIARRTLHCRSYYYEHRQDRLQKVFISVFFQPPSDSRGGAAQCCRGIQRVSASAEIAVHHHEQALRRELARNWADRDIRGERSRIYVYYNEMMTVASLFDRTAT